MINDTLIENDYRHNAAFREYVQKYCQKHEIGVSEALRHEVVKQVWKMYTEV